MSTIIHIHKGRRFLEVAETHPHENCIGCTVCDDFGRGPDEPAWSLDCGPRGVKFRELDAAGQMLPVPEHHLLP